MKVINISLEERIAGPTLRILQVARRLQDTDITTVVVLPKGDSDYCQELEKAGIPHYVLPVKRMRRSKNPLDHLSWLASLPADSQMIADIARKEKADIIHCNGLVQVVGGLAAKKAGCRVMWHLNDVAMPWYLHRLFRPVVESHADLVVFASLAVERHFACQRQGLRTGILHAPVDTSVFAPEATGDARSRIRRELNIPEASPVVGMVGNINFLKGVTDFVASAGLLAKLRPDIHFIHVGAKLATKQQLAEQVEQSVAELGLRSRFHLLGKQTNIQNFLSAMDIYVIPSLSEACPISLLEAMAMQRPIVATNVGGIPELIRNGEEGFLISPRDPAAIADRVMKYLDRPEMGNKYGHKARVRAIEHYDISRCVAMHEYYYRSLMETSSLK